jgi:thiamine biosynthesis lipoprotein
MIEKNAKIKKFVFPAGAILIAAVILIAFYLREPVLTVSTYRSFTMGSSLEIKLYGTDDEKISESIFAAVDKLDQKISRTVEGSEINAFNASKSPAILTEPPAFSAQVMRLLEKCWTVEDASGGAFSSSLGELIDLWGFNGEEPHIPSDAQIQAALAKGIFTPMTLDLGAAGKGAGCDEAAHVLRKTLPKNSGAVVNLGGNIFAFGSKNGKAFEIALRDPFLPNGAIGTFTIDPENYKNGYFISTSGSYEKFFEQEGVRYHHILDPKTGYPAQSGLVSVSVLTANGAYGDILSTACFVLGYENALPLLQKYGAEAVFVLESGEVKITKGLENGQWTQSAK